MMHSRNNAPDDASLQRVKAAKKILVVDDEVSIVHLIQLQLKFEGFQVVTAFDGMEALEKVAEEKPDLVVLDIMMPRVDGWVVCHSIKSNLETRNMRVIILSAQTRLMAKVKGLYIYQAEVYMTKPFDLDDLSGNINKLLCVAEEARGMLPSTN